MEPVDRDEELPADHDVGVDIVVSAIGALQHIVPYEWIWHLWPPRGKKNGKEKLAYIYVPVWIAVLSTILLTGGLWRDGSRVAVVAVAALAGVRLFDVTLYWVAFLLIHRNVKMAERTLIFAVMNLAEVMLIGAIWALATRQAGTAGGALFQAFGLVTRLQMPAATTAWAKVAVAVTELAALLLLLGALTGAISLVGKRLKVTGEYRGESKF